MSNNTFTCTACDKYFHSERGLRSHLHWHDPTYAAACSNNGENISKGIRIRANKDREIATSSYLHNPKHCKQCNNPLPYVRRGGTYCDQSCAAKFNNVARAKPKKSKPIRSTRIRSKLVCKECGTIFSVTPCESTRKYCSVACSNKNKYHPNSTRKKTCIYRGHKMDSGAEYQFALLLDKHQIQWIKNTTTYFSFTDSAGKTRKYYPDFYLKDYDHWVEIKGERYIREDDDLRLAAVGNIERIMSKDIRLPRCVTSTTPSRPMSH